MRRREINREIKQKANKQPLDISVLSARLSSRFKSFLLDSFLLTTPIVYLVMYVIMDGGDSFSQNRAMGWLTILALHLPLIVIMWIAKKQTPGLKAYELEVLDDKNYSRISLLQAIIRYLITLLSIISFFLLFVPFFRKDKKTIQDIISNTIILDKK
ncbi:MAG: hypothetical protein COA66_03865 [Arcobacter sp.]|nr:MAG: hypothetical protein COA66_03865 [Arcobacter sp.]